MFRAAQLTLFLLLKLPSLHALAPAATPVPAPAHQPEQRLRVAPGQKSMNRGVPTVSP